MNSIRKACEVLGSQTALAKALEVTPAAVNQWISGARPIPAEKCPAIERATKGQVRCEDLRPDVAWDVLRMQAGIEPAQAEQGA
ncbi:transcriptional regulator [Variovorax sp. DXTD-1]|uniref:transcriptional regulator n=1 Tax=Variovorax sp. DXTD-1 TaxID=2495592 RepID=UPI000F896B32|nr:helix-turn-helix domain-containing protein [Variovorax sp. DXTD-1]RST54125.1 helix-turn-helix domain-containing protein [Variovorax sp. DXTD-1]